jgi:predicted transcriptional regulator
MRTSPILSPEGHLALYLVFVAQREKLLNLDARRDLYQQVQKFPGLHLRELARALDMSPNHAKYHLRYLEKHGLLSGRKEEGYWRFYPRREGSVGMQETMSPQEKGVLALLRRPVPLHVTLILLDRENATLSELKDDVDVAVSTLHYHLRKMEKAELVESEKEGRERVYRLADADRILSVLVEYRPPDALVKGFIEAWEQLEL